MNNKETKPGVHTTSLVTVMAALELGNFQNSDPGTGRIP